MKNHDYTEFCREEKRVTESNYGDIIDFQRTSVLLHVT